MDSYLLFKWFLKETLFPRFSFVLSLKRAEVIYQPHSELKGNGCVVFKIPILHLFVLVFRIEILYNFEQLKNNAAAC